ncbi:MAG: endonuclease III [Bacteroidales bacterium]|nr:endonuclease III [Bacteroidales bacterium]
MTTRERYVRVKEYFEKNMPEAETELHYGDPFSLVVSVILSAQCTDKRVNMITPALMERFPTPYEMAAAEPGDIFPYIRSCSYPNNKARHLSAMARKIVNDFKGKVPESVDDLMSLPGVGRKTANVITLVAFGNPAMPVDTHVFRVAARLGLTNGAKTPQAAEQQLIKNFPRHVLSRAHHWLILHGRYVCIARKPKCGECGLREVCKYYRSQDKDEIKVPMKK